MQGRVADKTGRGSRRAAIGYDISYFEDGSAGASPSQFESQAYVCWCLRWSSQPLTTCCAAGKTGGRGSRRAAIGCDISYFEDGSAGASPSQFESQAYVCWCLRWSSQPLTTCCAAGKTGGRGSRRAANGYGISYYEDGSAGASPSRFADLKH